MDEQGISDLIKYDRIPVGALNASSRKKLSMALNQDMPLPTKSGLVRNWEGLAELVGIPYAQVRLLKMREDPTGDVLSLWEESTNPFVTQLLSCLDRLERYDILDDITPLIQNDALAHLSREEETRRKYDVTCPVQVREVTSGMVHSAPIPALTLADVALKTQNPETSSFQYARYDAYVSYTDADLEFVTRLISVMEVEYKLKLFVKDRDMLPGLQEYNAEVRMLHERCERILLVLSDEFLNNPNCEFQTMFAQALAVDNNLYARKVIPIIYKPCELPVGLKYIAKLDYTKLDVFGSFWQRLHSSISCPMYGSETRTGTVSSSPIMSMTGGSKTPNHLVANQNTTSAMPISSRSLTHLAGPYVQTYSGSLIAPSSTSAGFSAPPPASSTTAAASYMSYLPVPTMTSSQSLSSLPVYASQNGEEDDMDDKSYEMEHLSVTLDDKVSKGRPKFTRSPPVIKKKRYFFQKKIQEALPQ